MTASHSHETRRSIGRIFAGGLLALAALAPCGCDPVTASPRSESRETPRRGGTLRTTILLPRTLDPARLDDIYGKAIASQIFDGLVRLDVNLRPIPGIAEYWEISPDRLHYRFFLRRGVRFHDGREVTASDVAWTFQRIAERARHAASPGFEAVQRIVGARAFEEGAASTIAGVRVVDPHEIDLDLEKPHLQFLADLAYENLRIVPSGTSDEDGESAFGRSPIGAGPFRLASWTNDEIVLRRFDDYYGTVAYLDEVRWVSEDAFTAQDSPGRRFLAHDLEIVEAADDEIKFLDPDSRCTVVRHRQPSLYYIGFDCASPPLDDVRVRRALLIAMDRRGIPASLDAAVSRATGLIPPGLFGFSPRDCVPPCDSDRAAKLLAEAGHAGGEGVSQVVLWMTGPVPGLDQMIADLKRIGVTMVPKLVAWPMLKRALDQGAAPAFVLGYSGGVADGDQFLFKLFHSSGSANNFHYRSASVDEKLERASTMLNSRERYALCGEIEEEIVNDAPLVPLFHYTSTYVAQPTVHDLLMGPFGFRSLRLERVWLGPP
jgi:peptide/nickel transport system substrate-binding protein